jgi:hypothetical protein
MEATHEMEQRLAPNAREAPSGDKWYFRRFRGSGGQLVFAFSCWTRARLTAYLQQRRQVNLSPMWIGELLDCHGVIWRRTQRTTQHLADPEEVREDERPPQEPSAVVRWDLVQRDVGHLLKPVPGAWPERFLLKGFPSPAQLSRWRAEPSATQLP